MKYYAISEEELKQIYKIGFNDGWNKIIEIISIKTKDFLKFKKPINEIAGGKLEKGCYSYDIGNDRIPDSCWSFKIHRIFNKLMGKSIKIFIQEL